MCSFILVRYYIYTYTACHSYVWYETKKDFLLKTCRIRIKNKQPDKKCMYLRTHIVDSSYVILLYWCWYTTARHTNCSLHECTKQDWVIWAYNRKCLNNTIPLITDNQFYDTMHTHTVYTHIHRNTKVRLPTCIYVFHSEVSSIYFHLKGEAKWKYKENVQDYVLLI